MYIQNRNINALKISEEIFNSITHGVGAILGVIGLTIGLFTMSSKPMLTFSFIIYSICLISLMLASTLYHAFTFTKARQVFSILDHSGIFLLIAGSYTPIIVYLYSGWLQAFLLLLVWSLAIIGITLKASMPKKMSKYTMILYISLGWLALILIPKLITLPSFVLLLIIAGGIIYTLGASLLAIKKPFIHVAWHIFVVIAATTHFFAITLMI